MVKLVALYKKPTDVDAFEAHYRGIHSPLAEKMPGLRKLEVCRFNGSPSGDAKFYMMAEMYFDDRDAMMAALGSAEGRAAGKDVMGFAGDVLHMMFADVQE